MSQFSDNTPGAFPVAGVVELGGFVVFSLPSSFLATWRVVNVSLWKCQQQNDTVWL